jgi:glycosyltransferase involved in cell wall biosynthesis
MRNTDLWRTKFHTLIDRYTFSGVKYYVSNSEAARLRLMSIEKINPKKIIVIKNGINSKRFENLNSILYHDKLLSKDLFIKKYASLNDMNIDSDTFFIGYAARFTEVKDPMTALESFALFKKNHENSIFICVGKGPLEEKFMQRCADLKIENAVVKTGFLDDLSLFYQSLDIFVLTSYWEGIPNTVLEAMYFGVPVAACDSGGTSELLVHGKTGYVISSHKPSDIAEIWKNILNDREFVLNASLQSKMRVRRFFSQNHMIDRYEDLFIEIIG